MSTVLNLTNSWGGSVAKLYGILAIAAILSSSAVARTSNCRTDNPACQGYTIFGPAAVDRCISIRGQSRTDFCQHAGATQRTLIHPGDQYCAVFGATNHVPDQCSLHWITGTEPRGTIIGSVRAFVRRRGHGAAWAAEKGGMETA